MAGVGTRLTRRQILLLVYVIYLMFQLKSHAYMYESTPQHIIDEEATPGPAANWLDASSSDSSSSDSSDSDDSGRSRETMSKRVRRAIRATRRRKSSVISMETGESAVPTRSPSFGTVDVSPVEPGSEESSARPRLFPRLNSNEGNDEAIEDDKPHRHSHRRHRYSRKKHRKHKKRVHHQSSQEFISQETIEENPEVQGKTGLSNGEPRRVDFAVSYREGATEETAGRRPFTGLRGMSLRPVAKSLAPTVFVQPTENTAAPVSTGPVPRVRYGIRRTNSLPDRLNHSSRSTGAMMPSQIPIAASAAANPLAVVPKDDAHEDDLSRISAMLLLLCSTGVVALCAEFMVDSINGLVATSGVKEIFIGLIILPIVGNAAEHVTAITVAMKNKMDLAIGVAVGSSIQIALFITPLVVILGWILDKEMTLYFTLFETVCLFVSTFIVNFLVLDGRSNYLEGALLCATYVIIGTVAFFYPNADQASTWGSQ
jgi:Ca2+:H+ antiporter